jgi:hypothetical protein
MKDQRISPLFKELPFINKFWEVYDHLWRLRRGWMKEDFK